MSEHVFIDINYNSAMTEVTITIEDPTLTTTTEPVPQSYNPLITNIDAWMNLQQSFMKHL